MSLPTISVVMSVYNGERFLHESIESIIQQTYTDFEFIIVNDGSTDSSLDIIQKHAVLDSRIRVISRENRGLVYSLNEGLALAAGKFIARIDADDISLPDRFKLQLELMEAQQLDLCGCHFFTIDEEGKYLSARVVSTDLNFSPVVLARSVPFSHGSVMIRKCFLDKHSLQYGQTPFHKAEDYALWISCSEKGAKISNVDDFLFKYRHIHGSLSKQKVNLKHAFCLSNQYIKKNHDTIFECVKREGSLNGFRKPFEEDNLSYFLLKSLFYKNTFRKVRVLTTLNAGINIVNIFRLLANR